MGRERGRYRGSVRRWAAVRGGSGGTVWMRRQQGVRGLELPELQPSPGSLPPDVGIYPIPLLRRQTTAPPDQPRLMIDATGPVHRPAGPPLLRDRAGFSRYSEQTLPALAGKTAESRPRQPRISPACQRRVAGPAP